MQTTIRAHRPIMRLRETASRGWKLHGPYCQKCSARYQAKVPWPCRRTQAEEAHEHAS